MKIDAHQHFWKFNIQEYAWIDDSMDILQKDHLPDDLAKILKTNNFDGSIAVQARQTVEETQWLLNFAEQHSIIKGVVGWLDLRSDKLDEQLEIFGRHPKLVGLRHVVQGEPDDRFILGKKFMRGIEKLLDYDLAYDILIFPKQLDASIEFVKHFSEHRFVLDHIAKPLIKDRIISPWDGQIKQLASLPNVFCKVSGMVTEADWRTWSVSDFAPYLDVVFNEFGMDRVMFGSDWPVCTVAASYENVIEIVDKFLDKHNFSEEDKAAVWGGNAQNFYKINNDTTD